MSKVVLSPATIEILKVSAQVNQNLLFRADSNLVWSMSVAKNLVLKTTVAETFPVEFPVYNINEFLASIALFSKPELDFTDTVVTISEAGVKKGTKLKYVASAKQILVFPTKEAPEPEYGVEFKLTAATLAQILKASGVLAAPDLSIKSSEEGVSLRVFDKKNPSANVLEIPITSDVSGAFFTADIRIENLKLLPDEYDVFISARGIAKFTSSKMNLFVSLETSSSL
jgi:hypothetical protein